jgi:murein hydrolase activator
MRRGLVAAAALLLLAAAPTPEQLRQVEQARQADLAAQREAAARARAAAAQEEALGAQRADAAAKLRAAEDALARAAAQVADLSQRREAAEADLRAQSAALAPLLPLLLRLSQAPAATMLAVPLPPEQAVRGALVAGGIAHELDRRAAAVRAEQAQVEALQAQLDAAMPALRQAQDEQQHLAAALDSEIAQTQAARRGAEDAAAQAAQRAAADAAQAASIRAALDRIEADRRAAEARAREEQAAAERKKQADVAASAQARAEQIAQPAGKGLGDVARASLPAPVAGSLVRHFGDPAEGGPANGMTYQAPPGARVVSPCGGRVVFAGPFRSYGLLVIVDCGGGWHFVLSGPARLDVAVGQRIAAGEPVGVMAGWDPRKPPPDRPALYVELRRDGSPVDPAPFLRPTS